VRWYKLLDQEFGGGGGVNRSAWENRMAEGREEDGNRGRRVKQGKGKEKGAL